MQEIAFIDKKLFTLNKEEKIEKKYIQACLTKV